MANQVRKAATSMPSAAARLTQSCSGGGGGGMGGGHGGGGGGHHHCSTGTSHLTPLQQLQRLEISKHRAEKALAATGHVSAQAALDWLLAHCADPQIDSSTRREYILYACPTGAFLAQLERFWQRTRAEHGWNGAHNFMPHITLVSFFQAPDEYAPQLADALRLAVDMARASCGGSGGGGSAETLLDGRRPLQLELSTGGDSFMGFYVRDGETNDANMLQRLALQYVQNVKEVLGELISEKYEQMDALVTCFPWCGGVTNTQCIPRSSRSISLEPHDNKLHLTLAYKFPAAQLTALHAAAAAQLDPSAATQWELRLYSRDPQLAAGGSISAAPPLVVHRAVQPYGGGDGQLELRTGDLLYVQPAGDGEPTDTGDEWVPAISQRSGCRGAVALGRTERCAESEAWTLHETVALAASPAQQQRPDVPFIQELIRKSALSDLAHLDDSDTVRSAAAAGRPDAAQQLYVLRHGERVDFTFGPDWHRYAFSAPAATASNGDTTAASASACYRPRDLNMPDSLPDRAGSQRSWCQDGPLTQIGVHQAWLTGRRLRQAGVRMRHVYTSPAYRCVQTARALLDGLGQLEECALRVEPALFEWMVWYEGTSGGTNGAICGGAAGDSVPEWMTVAELAAAGFNVDADYVPMVTATELKGRLGESCAEFYERNSAVSARAVDELSGDAGGNILLVGHAVTLDSCTRHLTTGTQRSFADMTRLMPRIAYASLVLAERQPNGEREWRLAAPPCHGMTHNRNARFDWRLLAE